MNEKHNLDRLFQEKFKDFEAAPPDFVWENIQEKLQGKKKSRVIPLWLRLSGVAALLVLGGFITTLFFNDAENPAVNAPAVVIENTTATPADAIKASPDAIPVQSAPSAEGTSTENTTNTNINNTAVATAEGNTTNTTIGTSAAQPNTNRKQNRNILPSSANSNNAVAYEGQNTSRNKKNSKQTKNNTTIQQSDAVVSSESVKQSNRDNSISDPANASQNQKAASANDGLAVNDATSSSKNTNSNNQANQNSSAQKQNALTNAAAAEGVANADKQQNTNPANAETDPAAKNSIIDKNIPPTEAVAQVETDTTATIVPVNELEKLLQEKLNGKEEDKAVAETKKSKERWNIKPQVAPVFYNSLSEGSPINEQFASNSKSYDNDLSYGLGVNYAVTDRISIRSGINTVNLNYSTNDIAYYASLNNLTTNIGQSKVANIVVQNPGDATPEPFLINGQPSQLVEGSMLQKTGYIEVPLEMSYALVNKKFGIDVIGGVSTLFLSENNVSVVSNTGMSTQVGQAQNLNNLHFSTNVGVGFRYKFWDSFQANFEPTFKYQVNAYSKDAGNFKPYFIGLYSGVSFSF